MTVGKFSILDAETALARDGFVAERQLSYQARRRLARMARTRETKRMPYGFVRDGGAIWVPAANAERHERNAQRYWEAAERTPAINL